MNQFCTVQNALISPFPAVQNFAPDSAEFRAALHTQEPGLNLKENIKAYEKELIISALAEFQNNKTHTASALGISRRALMYKLQEYDIE